MLDYSLRPVSKSHYKIKSTILLPASYTLMRDRNRDRECDAEREREGERQMKAKIGKSVKKKQKKIR